MASGRRVAFVPPAGAVQEFKVQTASFDAADGHTAGAMVNVTLKSGTNALKGESYYYLRDESLSATDFFVNRSGGSKPQLDYKRFGGSLGGPVRAAGTDRRPRPHVLLRRHRVAVRPFPGARAADGADGGDAQRRFLVAARAGHHYLRSGHRAAGQRPGRAHAVSRQHHPGEPHQSDRAERPALLPGAEPAGDAPGRNNYFTANPRSDDFYSIRRRVDHRLTDKQQLFVRYTRNDRRESRNALFGEVDGVVPTGNFLFRKNDGITADHVYTMSSSSLLNFRGGWQQIPGAERPAARGDVRSRPSLGFAPRDAVAVRRRAVLPARSTSTRSPTSATTSPATRRTSIYSFQPTYTLLGQPLGASRLRRARCIASSAPTPDARPATT